MLCLAMWATGMVRWALAVCCDGQNSYDALGCHDKLNPTLVVDIKILESNHTFITLTYLYQRRTHSLSCNGVHLLHGCNLILT